MILSLLLFLLSTLTTNSFIVKDFAIQQFTDNKSLVRKTITPMITTFASKEVQKTVTKKDDKDLPTVITIKNMVLPIYIHIDLISAALTTTYKHVNEFGGTAIENIPLELLITFFDDRCIKRTSDLFAPIKYKNYIIFHDKNMLSVLQATGSSLAKYIMYKKQLTPGKTIDFIKDNALKEFFFNALSQTTHRIAKFFNIKKRYVEYILPKNCITKTEPQRVTKIIFSLLFSYYITPHIPRVAPHNDLM